MLTWYTITSLTSSPFTFPLTPTILLLLQAHCSPSVPQVCLEYSCCKAFAVLCLETLFLKILSQLTPLPPSDLDSRAHGEAGGGSTSTVIQRFNLLSSCGFCCILHFLNLQESQSIVLGIFCIWPAC